MGGLGREVFVRMGRFFLSYASGGLDIIRAELVRGG